jgi:signal transduction histidine kinase
VVTCGGVAAARGTGDASAVAGTSANASLAGSTGHRLRFGAALTRAGRDPVLVAAAVAVAAAASVGAAYVLATSDHTADPGVTAALTVITASAFVLAGLVAWWRRPDNRIGPLMVLTGFLWFLSALPGSSVGVLFTVGYASASWAKAVFTQTVLAYPEGRLHSRLERVLVVALYIDVVVGQFVTLTFTPLPWNRVLIHGGDAEVARELLRAQRWFGFAIVAAALLVLGLRLRHGSAPLRRAVVPVLVTGALTLALAGATIVANEVGAASAVELNLAQIAAFGLMPIAFLAGLLRSRLARFGVAELVVELSATPEPGALRGTLARALGDPSLELAYWLPASGSYADAAGRPFELPAEGAGRAVTRIESGGDPVAALIHDPALDEDPELVAGVGAAAALALANERLQAELRAKVEELRASRARIVEAGDEERRRLERNLHDGAQQRLLALSFSLGLAETQVPEELAAVRDVVREAKQEVGEAIEELRELAHGIHPQILSERGLAAALETLAARSPIPVKVRASEERLPDPVEAAAYYVVSEALANATKHAQAQRLEVRVDRHNGTLAIEVADDGVGGASTSAGSGLRGLLDRVEALDGRLYVTSPPGGGTTIRAEIPCAS